MKHPSQETAQVDGRADRPPLTRLAVASCSGTAIEYYDFLAYAIAAATVFDTLFFPTEDELVGTILAFGTFAVGFLMRPLGGIVFGHFGDRLGRKRMLMLTLLMMGIATMLIGLLPTYEQVGVWAPVGLIVLRLVQGFSAGGEFGGAALVAIEHAPEGRKGLFGSFTVLGVSIGAVMAAGAFALLGGLSPEEFISWGWRLPFLASVVLIGVGLFVRFGISETPEFTALREKASTVSKPITQVIRDYPRTVLLAVGTLVGYSTFVYIVFTFLLAYGTQQLGMSRNTLLYASMVGLGLQVITIPALAALSDRIGRRPVMLAGALFLVVYPFLLFPLIRTESTLVILVALILAYNGAAAVHAPMAAFFAELFGTGVRYSGVSLGYQLGNVLGGGLAPVVATSLFAATGRDTLAVSLYAAAVSAISVVCLLALPNTGGSTARSTQHRAR